jgi:hypothetical protein
MRPGTEFDVALVLDKKAEVRTLEAGLSMAGLEQGPLYGRLIEEATYPESHLAGVEVVDVAIKNPRFNIHRYETPQVIRACNEIIAIGGIKGLVEKTLGQKRRAKRIIQALDG